MAKIQVHLLNFHSIFTHIEIVLVNTSTNPPTYFNINRWVDAPQNAWSDSSEYRRIIDEASSTFNFMIEADPQCIQQEWNRYWYATNDTASILGNNCAVAAQWFLSRFANIPSPNRSNISLNHLALGIVWPSFIPSPVMLPGRVMSNAKFYVKAKEHPEQSKKYSNLFLHVAMAAAVVTVAASVLAIYVALNVLTAGLASVVIAGAVIGGLAGSYGFFSAYNKLSAKQIVDKKKASTDPKGERANPTVGTNLTPALAVC